MKSTLNLFTDGGCISRNPSKIGGTWAWCLVDRRLRGIDLNTQNPYSEKILTSNCGVIRPIGTGLETISNNFSELYAAVEALETISGFRGTLYTDSLITLHRITDSHSFKGIPDWLRDRCLKVRKDRKYDVELLGGHPTKNELLAGVRKDGKPVSIWNQWVDRKCSELARKYLENNT